MFDFLKPKAKLPPHEMGRGLALVISEQFWPKIKDQVDGFRDFPGMSESNIESLCHFYHLYYCTSVSLILEWSSIPEDKKKIVMDYFWNFASKYFGENNSEGSNDIQKKLLSLIFKGNVGSMYPKIRDLRINPLPNTDELASNKFAKKMMTIAIPEFKTTVDNVGALMKLMGDLAVIQGGMEEFVPSCIKSTELI